MSKESLTDNEIQALLSSITGDGTFAHPDREQLREIMIAEFREHASSVSLESGRSEGALVDVKLEPVESSVQPPTLPWPRLVLAVAASVLVLVVASMWLRQSSDQMVDASDADLPALVADETNGAPSGPGRYSAEGVGGGIQITLPDEVRAVTVEPGLVELQPVDNAWGSSLFIMTAEASLDELLETYREAGLITTTQGVGVSVGGIVGEFEVRPTNAGFAEECRQDPNCLAFEGTRIQPGATNIAREILGPDGRGVWTLYQSDTVNAPFVQGANSIIASLEFTTD